MRTRLKSAALGTLLILAACGETSVATEGTDDLSPVTQAQVEEESVEEEEVEQTAPPLPSTTEPPPGVVVRVQCPENASCAEEFILNGRTYSQSCTGVLEEAVVLDNVLGSGQAFSQPVEVFAIDGFPDGDIVAVNVPSGCTEDPNEEISPWSFAWVSSAQILPVICELGLLSAEQREANNCPTESG